MDKEAHAPAATHKSMKLHSRAAASPEEQQTQNTSVMQGNNGSVNKQQ
jgi:hypothetical protein